ncbi:MAG: xanthan lyase [Bacteroidales bacterium]|nr:xanthan lyase [Bacteroidales bacterium]
MFKKLILSTLAVASLIQFSASAQTASELKPACDSLTKIMKVKTSVDSPLKLEKVMRRGQLVDFYFGQNLSDFPWRQEDVAWFKEEIRKVIPEKYRNLSIGGIYCKGVKLESLVMPDLGNDGHPTSNIMRRSDPKVNALPVIEQVGAQKFDKGMSGRYISLWQSHGRYFEAATDRWEWQRATLLQTVEDMYTQSYVLPFLMPMLENAGAYCLTPRERDTQRWEVVADNDKMFSNAREGFTRKAGTYSETGSWESAGEGFADAKMIYSGNDNPFKMGTARKADAVSSKSSKKSEAKWGLNVPERGEYAVYISYKTLENSTTSAHYTVHHMGGNTEFIVDQTRGGSTWMYLGTFEFAEGTDNWIVLDNVTPDSREHKSGKVVTADGVRIGGGMGKIARGLESTPVSEWTTSGLPAFTEGALYSMQWAGVDEAILTAHDTDYTNDYADRGAWTKMMAGGSPVNPKEEGKGIPFDLSFAFHTDAGTFPADSIVGTLSIYTLLEDGNRKLPNGEDRMLGRALADQVQSQIVQDIRADYEPNWTRRQLWDRSYSESRTTGVPGMLLEHLSHQNFADMKYGLDATYRFEVSRAIYKGMLKFLSNRYGCDYAVQPLPVNSFAATLESASSKQVKLQWKATDDKFEPTAKPTGYILYTRIDGGAFDRSLKDGFVGANVSIAPGHIYSYKVVAFNEGGKSFPSEILSVGIPANGASKVIAVVNNFDRLSSPAWYDTPTVAGFDNNLDSGVDYIKQINFIGEMYNNRREQPWIDDDCPGFGASWQDKAGELIPGNTFDYPYIHGKAIMNAGYAFYSTSRDAFSADQSIAKGSNAMDIICGKQVTVKIGRGVVDNKYSVFPAEFQNAISSYTSNGGSILISGAHIGTDVWDQVYPVEIDSKYRESTQKFVESTLGYSWRTNYATRSAKATAIKNDIFTPSSVKTVEYYKDPNSVIYNVETADGIIPASSKSKEFLRYTDTNISAGVSYQTKNYKVVSLGFPIETIKESSTIDALIKDILAHLTK